MFAAIRCREKTYFRVKPVELVVDPKIILGIIKGRKIYDLLLSVPIKYIFVFVLFNTLYV